MDELWDHIRRTTRPLGQGRAPIVPDKDPLDRPHSPTLSHRRALRGQYRPEATIDLHDMTIQQAHDQLRAFLLRCHHNNKRLILVITGKGKNSAPYQRTIKESFREWISLPAFSPYIAWTTPSAQKHGGDGAFYVALRKA